MPRLRLMCGLAGAGKSTYARTLEADGWLRFSIAREAFEVGYHDAPLPAEVVVLRQRLAARRGRHSDEMSVADGLLTDCVPGFEVPGFDEDDVTVVRLHERQRIKQVWHCLARFGRSSFG